MKCPKCGSGEFAYNQKRFKSTRDKRWERTDYTAECRKCGNKQEAQ